MIFSTNDIDKLRTDIAAFMSEERYLHTLGVERAALKLGEYIMPDRLDELAVAALLHDITKRLKKEEHWLFISKSNLSLTEEDLKTYPALHSFSAVPFIKQYFAEYATDDICRAVFLHTLGGTDMTLFDEIIYLADYIEDGRIPDACKKTAERVMAALDKAFTDSDKKDVIHRYVYLVMKNTEKHLKEQGRVVNYRTLSAINKYKIYDDME